MGLLVEALQTLQSEKRDRFWSSLIKRLSAKTSVVRGVGIRLSRISTGCSRTRAKKGL